MTRRELLASLVALAATYAFPRFRALGQDTGSSPTLPAYPRLLLDKAGLGELKTRISSQVWAKDTWDGLKTNVTTALAKPINLPPRGGNWSHNYVCPIHGTRLRRGKQIAPWKWEHICPTGPHILKGDPAKGTTDFDGNGIMDVHLNNAGLISDAGLLYQMTGEDRYATYAHDLLLAYANHYLSYEMHDKEARLHPASGGGRIACQPLTEASWFIGMTHGADFVWDKLTPDERTTIETKMMRPALQETFLTSKLGIHNIQCRINAAIGLIGFLLGDNTLISTAIDDPKHGFRKQIAEGIRPDGMWAEGSTGYHFFTIDGLWPLIEAARHCGMDLSSTKFKSMFDGPFNLARPDNVLPNFNDSGDSPLASHAGAYEYALAKFKDPRYASVIESAENTPVEKGTEENDEGGSGRPRHDRMAFYFGVSPLPDVSILPRTSHNDTGSGYAIIQRGNDASATWLCVKYGPHGGGHGHPDKNHFILYTRGAVLAPDVGSHAYGSPLHAGWDKTTLCHNTLTVDETSQTPAEGKSLAFGSTSGIDYSITDAGPIYPGVNFIRTAALIDENLIIFVDQITSEKSHTFDLAYHQMGEWKDLPPGKDWQAPKAIGYNYFSKTTTRTLPEGITLTSVLKDKTASSLTLAAGPNTEVITGVGVLRSTENLIPMTLLRRKAQRTTYVWAISLDGSAVEIKTMPVRSDDDKLLSTEVAIGVKFARGEEGHILLVNPQRKSAVLNAVTTSEPFALVG